MNSIRQYTIHHIPFLRILLPLFIGIAWQYLFPATYIMYIWVTIAIICAGCGWLFHKNALSHTFRYAFTGCTSAFMVVVGMICFRCHLPQEVIPEIYPETIAIARIESLPVESDYTYRTYATIVALQDSATSRKSHIPVILNIKKSHTAKELQGGDLILFHPELQRIVSPSLPQEYDYARQMALKGVLYRQYLRDTEWHLSSYTTPLTLRDYATRIQSRCISILYECGLSNDNASILVALLWGYRDDISDTTRDYFSAAGMSHILAVSGLHTGIIAFILWFLLYPLRYTRWRKLQHILTILLLWMYAFITGLSPSVIRACLMATFIGVAHLIDRRNTSLNALCGSAVLTLLISPIQLFDVGFQLSYTAVAGILLLAPHCDISRYIKTEGNLLRYATATIAVSVAAQIATLPLAAYYFHYIPLWGLLSNILFVPILPLIVITALLLQLCHVWHVPHLWLTYMTDGMTDILTNGAESIALLPASTISGIWITLPMLVLYNIILFSIWYMLSRQTLRIVITPLTAIISLLIITIADTVTPSTPRAYVPTDREYTHLQLANENHNCYIITTDTTHSIPRRGENWRISQHLKTHIVHTTDTIRNSNIYIALPFIQYYDKRLLWVDDNTWRYCSSDSLYAVDCAIVTELYKGKISHLTKNFNISHIILSASIYPERAETLQAECYELTIDCCDMHHEREADILHTIISH